MSLILLIIVILVILALVVWAIRSAPVPAPLNWILQVLAIVVAVLVILMKSGLA